jgi:hypothetical protein
MADEFQQLHAVFERLFRDAAAKAMFFTDMNGQLLHSIGLREEELALAERCAGATLGTALSETEYVLPIGNADSLYVAKVAELGVLGIAFDERSSLGHVRAVGSAAALLIGSIVEKLAARQRIISRGS